MMNSKAPRSMTGRSTAASVAMIAAALSLGLAVSGAAPDDAFAKRKKKSRAASVVEKAALPLVINVSLRRQRLTVYQGTKAITGAPVSSGSDGRETPLGIFSVIAKRRMHYSNLYNSAPMPFMQRITWSGIAMHHGRLPGYPASHGCIRLPRDFAEDLYSMTGRGTRVIVSREPVRPRNFYHARLFKPLPPVEAVQKAAPAPAPAAGSGGPAPGTQPAAAVSQAAGGQLTTTSATVITPAGTTGTGTTGTGTTGTGTPPAANEPPPAQAAPARAAPAVAPAPVALFPGRLNRAQLVAARKARREELKAAVASGKVELAAARKSVKARKSALRAAADTHRFVNSQVRQLNKTAKKAERIAIKASKDLVNFENSIAGTAFDPVIDAVKFENAVAREDALESRYFELSEDAEIARHDAASMQGRLFSDSDAVNRAIQMLSDAEDARKAAVAALGATKAAYKKAKRQAWLYKKPIAIFISRKKERIYVRQGFESVLEAPVTIADPDQPMGTHIYTALEFTKNKTDLRWSLVSIKGDAARSTKSKRARRKRGQPEKVINLSPAMLTARRALERIEIPTDALYRIAELIKPGSSLIISDRRMSDETGWGTDFIVSLR